MQVRRGARRRAVLAAVGLGALGLGVLGTRLDWWARRPTPLGHPFTFADGFEGVATTDDLFAPDGGRWHGLQCETGDGLGPNRVELSSERAHSGRQSLKFVAQPYDGRTASKADIVRGGLHFVQGDDVWFTGWFYLVGTADVSGVFLWDLEDDRKYHVPGRRLYVQAGGSLASDLGKWHTGPTFRPSPDRAVPFPTDQWVRLRVHLRLSAWGDGRLCVWQGDRKVLDGRGQTLPTSRAIYNRLQVGITANGGRTAPRRSTSTT